MVPGAPWNRFPVPPGPQHGFKGSPQGPGGGGGLSWTLTPRPVLSLFCDVTSSSARTRLTAGGQWGKGLPPKPDEAAQASRLGLQQSLPPDRTCSPWGWAAPGLPCLCCSARGSAALPAGGLCFFPTPENFSFNRKHYLSACLASNGTSGPFESVALVSTYLSWHLSPLSPQ